MRVTPILLAGACALALAATTLPARADGPGDGWHGNGGPGWQDHGPRGDWRGRGDRDQRYGDRREGGWHGDDDWHGRPEAYRGEYYAPPPVVFFPPSLNIGVMLR